MQSGLLTDTFTREHVARFAEDDWRRRSPDFNEPNLSRNLALRDALRPIAQRHRTTVSTVAVAWTLAWPGVTGAIVGARSPQQVDGWIGSTTLKLTSADLVEISNVITRTGAGEGPTMPQLQYA
jgi:aryl-alcohol dehydrogenase-like predicted oxidoreductase